VLVAFVLIFLMQNTLRFWVFQRVDVFYIFKIPFFLAVSWFPFIVAFAHLLAQYKNIPLIIVIMLAFPLGAVFIHILLLNSGMLLYNNWNLILTFFLSLGIHAAIALTLFAKGYLRNLRKGLL